MQVQSDSPVRPHLTPEQIALKKHEINRAIEQMAAILSESLKDADVRCFVKREVLKKFDSDYEARFAYALNLRTEGGETFCTKLSRGLQYYQSRHYGQSVDSESSKMQIEQIIRTVPLFQFGIPFYVVHKWNPETDIPPVVCLPDGCDKGSKMERVKASKDGQAFWIETAEYLKNPYPVVVLGINERVDKRGQLKRHLLFQNPDNGKVEVKTSQAVTSSTGRRFDLVVTELVICPNGFHLTMVTGLLVWYAVSQNFLQLQNLHSPSISGTDLTRLGRRFGKKDTLQPSSIVFLAMLYPVTLRFQTVQS